MQFQMFCFTKPYFSWSWKLDPDSVQREISNWLAQNKGIVVREIKHDTVASFWYPPQLFVSLYYQAYGEKASDVAPGRGS